MDSSEYALFFTYCPDVGPKTYTSLLKHFGSPERAYLASENDLKVSGLGIKKIEKLIAFRETFDPEKEIQTLREKGIWFLTRDEFPSLFATVQDMPILLFGIGNREALFEEKTIGIVGSRRPTSYGISVTQSFTQDLVAAGFVVVSGLAMGIDGIAHRECLRSGGKTIAVLGSGIDMPTPEMNRSLYHDIIKAGGVVVSEYAPGTPPNHGTFPARNRIISGLSQAIIIPEATEDSGALITARHAFEEGKKVFAVPGQITSRLSKGPAGLFKQGGIMVTSVQDILEELGQMGELHKKEREEISDPLILLLIDEAKSTDQIVRESGKGTAEVSSHLTMLELSGLLIQRNGKWEIVE